MLYLYHCLFASILWVHCRLCICFHCLAFRQLSGGERWKGSKRLSVSSLLESCKDNSDLSYVDLHALGTLKLEASHSCSRVLYSL